MQRASAAIAVAAVLRLAVSSPPPHSSLVARFGGDEFAILLPETDARDAEAKLNEIRAVVDRPMRLQEGTEMTVTSSAGMAVAPLDGHDATTLLTKADDRLMAAKRNGRNRLVATT